MIRCGRSRRLIPAHARRGPVPDRRIRFGQDRDHAGADAAVAAPACGVVRGRVRVGGRDVLALGEAALTQMRGSEIAMVFQEPMTALDPVYNYRDQIAETVMRHEGCSRRTAMARALELLRLVRVPSPERRLARLSARVVGRLAPSAPPLRSRCRAGRACCSPTSLPPRSTPPSRSRC